MGCNITKTEPRSPIDTDTGNTASVAAAAAAAKSAQERTDVSRGGGGGGGGSKKKSQNSVTHNNTARASAPPRQDSNPTRGSGRGEQGQDLGDRAVSDSNSCNHHHHNNSVSVTAPGKGESIKYMFAAKSSRAASSMRVPTYMHVMAICVQIDRQSSGVHDSVFPYVLSGRFLVYFMGVDRRTSWTFPDVLKERSLTYFTDVS